MLCTSLTPVRLNAVLPNTRSRCRARSSYATRPVCSAEQTAEDQGVASPSTCKTCGTPLREVPRGCNQEGRVAGGIGAVVGFDWWPIKAYKPCPKAAKAGVLYTRKGQITDEMLFGRGRDQR